MAIDFNTERYTEKGAHEHQSSEHEKIVERRIDDERFDDIAGDQELQTEQDAAAKCGTKRNECIAPLAFGHHPQKAHAGVTSPCQDRDGSHDLQDDHREAKHTRKRYGCVSDDHTIPCAEYC